jgi:hypothetical protein
MTKPEDAPKPAGGTPVDCQVRPCPFCGSSKGTDEQGETYRWRLWRCSECGACGPETRCNIAGSGQGGVKEARKLAADEWNRQPLFDAAVRALEAWDSTVLPRSHDGMMQERMERLRTALAGPNVGGNRLAPTQEQR